MTVLKTLQTLERPVFTTRNIAQLAGTSLASASQILTRLASDNMVAKVSRGLWCIPSDHRFHPLMLVPYLCGSHQAYVSFFTALNLHGIISQIPQIIYTATTAHSRVQQTKFGTFSYHRIHPGFFKGFTWHGKTKTFLCAEPEKALVDCLYISSRKGKRFGHFPELDLTGNFDHEKALNWIDQIQNRVIQKHVATALQSLLAENQP